MSREWLKTKRTEKNLTMKQMADSLGITESYYCNIENGKRKQTLDVKIITKLSMILNLPTAVILEQEVQSNG